MTVNGDLTVLDPLPDAVLQVLHFRGVVPFLGGESGEFAGELEEAPAVGVVGEEIFVSEGALVDDGGWEVGGAVRRGVEADEDLLEGFKGAGYWGCAVGFVRIGYFWGDFVGLNGCIPKVVFGWCTHIFWEKLKLFDIELPEALSQAQSGLSTKIRQLSHETNSFVSYSFVLLCTRKGL